MKYRALMNKVDSLLKNSSEKIGSSFVNPFINFSLFFILLGSSIILVAIPELSFTLNIFGSSSIDTINESISISNSFFITACFIFITIVRAMYFFYDLLILGFSFFRAIKNLSKDIVAFKKEQEYKNYRKNIQKYPY